MTEDRNWKGKHSDGPVFKASLVSSEDKIRFQQHWLLLAIITSFNPSLKPLISFLTIFLRTDNRTTRFNYLVFVLFNIGTVLTSCCSLWSLLGYLVLLKDWPRIAWGGRRSVCVKYPWEQSTEWILKLLNL